MLSPLQKQYRVDCCKEFFYILWHGFYRYYQPNKTWFHFQDAESEQELMQCHTRGSPVPNKFLSRLISWAGDGNNL